MKRLGMSRCARSVTGESNVPRRWTLGIRKKSESGGHSQSLICPLLVASYDLVPILQQLLKF